MGVAFGVVLVVAVPRDSALPALTLLGLALLVPNVERRTARAARRVEAITRADPGSAQACRPDAARAPVQQAP